jgi:hypothetical protein
MTAKQGGHSAGVPGANCCGPPTDANDYRPAPGRAFFVMAADMSVLAFTGRHIDLGWILSL